LIFELIDLYSRVDFRHKPEARKESNCSGEQANTCSHNQHITKVQYRGRHFTNVQLTVEEVTPVQEEVHPSHSGR
jgi:hypothetical protein